MGTTQRELAGTGWRGGARSRRRALAVGVAVGAVGLLAAAPSAFASGASLVADINPVSNSDPSGFTKLGDYVYFSADDGTHGRELWRSNGTAAGTSSSGISTRAAAAPLRAT
jgi:hypothetical protein